jgi:hypothetical protein
LPRITVEAGDTGPCQKPKRNGRIYKEPGLIETEATCDTGPEAPMMENSLYIAMK